MAEVVERGTCVQAGVGKPDYSREVARAIDRPGISLKYGQRLTMALLTLSNTPSYFSWVTTPLAAGGTIHPVNPETDLPYPYTTPAGYNHALIQRTVSVSEDIMIDSYLDTLLSWNQITYAGQMIFKQDIIKMETKMIDPDCEDPHIVDTIITNLGPEAMLGSVADIGLLTPCGTQPLPSIKTVRCKWCGHEQEVPVETTHVICPECGKLTIYYSLSKLRES